MKSNLVLVRLTYGEEMILPTDREWFDENGLMHHVHRPTEDSSENELLFTAEYMLLSGVDLDAHESQLIFESMYKFYVEEWEAGKHMSHDNRTGIIAVGLYDNYSIFKAGKRLWLHPRDWIYWGYMKYGWPFAPLMPIVSMFNIWSCMIKNRNGVPTTSGKMLALTRNLGANLKLTNKICGYFVKKHFGSWANMAKIYYPYTNDRGENHPIVRLIAYKEMKGEL
jgi:hypothetical protein